MSHSLVWLNGTHTTHTESGRLSGSDSIVACVLVLWSYAAVT